MGGRNKSAMCVNKNSTTRTCPTNVKSVVGMYIRGEKRIEEIVHPSKITRKISDMSKSLRYNATSNCSVSNCMKVVNTTSQRTRSQSTVNAISHQSVTVADNENCEQAVTNFWNANEKSVSRDLTNTAEEMALCSLPSDKETPPIKIDSVNHIKFDGSDMVIKLKSDGESKSTENRKLKTQSTKLKRKTGIECNIHPNVRNEELDLLIEPLNNHIVSEMMLNNKNLKLLVKSMEDSDITTKKKKKKKKASGVETKLENIICAQPVDLSSPSVQKSNQLPLSLSNISDSKKKLRLDGSTKENEKPVQQISSPANTEVSLMIFSDDSYEDSITVKSNWNESDNGSTIFTLPENQLKPLKTDVYYYKEKIAHEQVQINDLKEEINEAEQILQEYENEKLQKRNEYKRSFSKKEFERLLSEFLCVSDFSCDRNESGVGLNFLITDYFTKYYDNLNKKIDQFNRERSALLMVVDNLKKDRQKLQNHINTLRSIIEERARSNQ